MNECVSKSVALLFSGISTLEISLTLSGPGCLALTKTPGGAYMPPLVFHLNEGLETPNLKHELIYTIRVPMQNLKSELLKITDL